MEYSIYKQQSIKSTNILAEDNLGVLFKTSKGAKIRNWYNQVPHLTQDTKGKVTNSQLDTTNESQKVSPLPAGDHKQGTYKQTRTKA